MPSMHEWYAELLRAGLETKLFSEAEVLAKATPQVLVTSLPKDVLTRLLAGGITSGTMSPATVLQTVTPEILSAHVKPAILWACVAAAAEQGGLIKAGAAAIKDEAAKREFLRRALQSALTTAMLSPKDVIGHVDASVLIHHLPDELTSKLLETSLAAGRIDAAMVIDVIGVPALAKHAPPPVLWACLAQAGEKLPDAIQPVAPAARRTETKPPEAKPAEVKPLLAPAPAPLPIAEVKHSVITDVQLPPVIVGDFEDLDTNVPIELEDAVEALVGVAEIEPIPATRKSGLLSRIRRS